MLVASSDATLIDSRLKTAVFIERRFRLYSAWRERLLFDTKFAVGPRQPTGAITLLFVMDGHVEVAGQPVRHAPLAFALDETEYERVQPGALTLRTWGEPYVSFELRVPRAEVPASVRVGLANGPLALSEATWQAAFALADAIATEQLEPAPLRAFLASVEHDGVLVPGVSASIQTEAPHIDRMWSALSPYYQKQATATTLLHVKRVLGLSLRQLQRDMTDLIRTFQLFGDGFRETQKVLRLRAALLWISAPEVTLAEVATHVGYKSVDAMTRAFRDERQPLPSALRDLVRAPH